MTNKRQRVLTPPLTDKRHFKLIYVNDSFNSSSFSSQNCFSRSRKCCEIKNQNNCGSVTLK